VDDTDTRSRGTGNCIVKDGSAPRVIRSVLNTDASRATTKASDGQDLRANQHMSGGKKGERCLTSSYSKRKHKQEDGEDIYSCDKNSPIIGRTPRGSKHATQLLKTTGLLIEQVHDIPDYETQRKANLSVFRKNSMQFSSERVDKKIQRFAASQGKVRVPTAAKRATGIDVTGTSSGMLKISDLKANLHRHALTEELTLRGAPASRNMNTMKAALKEHPETREKKYFEPRTELLKALLADGPRVQQEVE